VRLTIATVVRNDLDGQGLRASRDIGVGLAEAHVWLESLLIERCAGIERRTAVSITYSGITPTLVFATDDLQGTENLDWRPSKTKGVPGKLVKNRDGVCQSLVIDWIQKSKQTAGGVTDKSQLKSGLALALMQTAYMRDVFDDDGVVETHGLSVNTANALNRKTGLKGLLQRDPLIQIGTACAGLVGYALINIYGGGGHALGYKQKDGVVQFFDPNEGILQFSSSQEFAKWFPSYIKGEYPDLLDSVTLKKITG
jgi:virulence surface antigen